MDKEEQWLFHHELGNRFAVEGARVVLWLNGIATLLAMFSQRAAWLFAFGTIFAAGIFLFSYLTQLHYGNGQYRTAVFFHRVTYVAVGLSLVCFLLGAIISG